MGGGGVRGTAGITSLGISPAGLPAAGRIDSLNDCNFPFPEPNFWRFVPLFTVIFGFGDIRKGGGNLNVWKLKLWKGTTGGSGALASEAGDWSKTWPAAC